MSNEMIVMTDDQYLEDGQAIKTQVINKICSGGVPESEERIELLLKVLDSRDKVALGRKRIDVEANVGSQAAAATALIADVLRGYDGSATPYVVDSPVERTLPSIPTSVPTPVLVEDETSVNAKQLSWDQFVSLDEVGNEAEPEEK